MGEGEEEGEEEGREGGRGERGERDVGTMSGLNVLRVINDPTAAAIAYGLGKDGSRDRSVLI